MILLLLASLLSATLEGRVVSVHDGDTVTVLVDNEQVKVRLAEIDAPELKQPFGAKSKQSLSSKVFNKSVRVESAGKDRYGRTLGTVYLGEESVNLWMVKEGWAWRYDRYSKSDILRKAQEEARAGKRGLWAGSEVTVPPWEWRKRKSPLPAPRTPLQSD